MSEQIMISLAAVVVLGAAAQWFAWRLGLPSILLLLLVGFGAGSLTGVIQPDQLLGELLFPIVSLSVALILYEGGLTLSLRDLPRVGGVVRNLVSIGAIITWVVAAAGAYYILGLSPSLAILLGAILIVTGPTVILPMLNHIRPAGKTGTILKWEGIVIDPVGALLAVLVFEAIAVGEARAATAHFLEGIAMTLLVGGGLGIAAAGILTLALKKYWIPDFLQNATSLMLVVLAFTVSNGIQHESGLLTVTIMGIALANQKWADVKHIVEFKENLRVLLISALFILLAARMQLSDLREILVPGIAFAAALILIARPATVLVSTLRSDVTIKEKLFLSSMAPRGIVAAAVSSVFAIRLTEMGFEDARKLVPATFLVIIVTVTVYGLLSPIAARALGVAEKHPRGIVFVGAQEWVRKVAKLLEKKGISTVLVDTNRASTSAARMDGLRAHTGGVLADHLLEEIDLGGMGYVCAVTPNDWVNVLSVQRFSPLFGRANCYQLWRETDEGWKQKIPAHAMGRQLFEEGCTNQVLSSRIAAGATPKATRLSEAFDAESFRELYGRTAIPMFVIREDGKLSVATVGEELKAEKNDTLIALVFEPPEQKKENEKPARKKPAETATD